MRPEKEEMLFQKIRVKKTLNLNEREIRRRERKRAVRAKQRWHEYQLNHGHTT